MKEKLTLYIDKDIKERARKRLKKTSFKSISQFVETQLDKLNNGPTKGIVQGWVGILDETSLNIQAKTDKRLQRILEKHAK